jgi:hypothetical protein
VGYPPQYGPPSRGETSRGLAAIMIMVVGLLIGASITVFTVLNPPSSPASSPSTQGPDHSETSVRQAAQLMLDTYASGSYGDFWDMWSTEAQGLITREEYVRLFQLCPQRTPGTSFTITKVTVTGDDANVQATRLSEAAAFDFLFESGSWRSVPSPDLRREYQSKTVDQMVQERQAAGTCGAAAATPPATSPVSPPVTPPATPPVTPPATPPATSETAPPVTLFTG